MTANILVVEDERIVARDLKLTLEDLGYRVPAITDSGEQAIKTVAEVKPDLILMDIRLLGEMDGIATAQIIAREFDLPVVFLTAHSDDVTLTRVKTAEPYGYLIKPFEERELRSVIEIAIYKHKMERQLKENAQWLSSILYSIGDAVITTDTQGRITLLNPVAEKLTGWSSNRAIGRDSTEVFQIVNEISRKTVSNPIRQALDTRKIVTLPEQTLLIAKDGREIQIEDSVAPIARDKGVVPLENSTGQILGAVIVFRDVTQHRLTAQRLHRQAFYDNLTGLPNRAWFRERLTDAIERVRRRSNYLFAFLYLDLDRFKTVNDSMGHPTGDHLLISVAVRLTKCVRTIDTVARLGGDEFAILLENLQSEREALMISQRIQQAFSRSFNLDGYEVFTNVSMGVVLSSIGYENIEEIIQDADIAMYQAKAKGRGCYEVFDTTMRDRVVAASQLESDLRLTIEEGQLMVYYQPIVDLATQETIGLEALVRWHHPLQGWISPQKFIPLAEETGLILQIDNQVWLEACRQVKRWQDRHSNCSSLKLSVNLSPREFIQQNLVEQIDRILEQTGLNASSLTVELTESILIENPELASIALGKLKDRGISLSLDDFGTGYSSLSYLHRFPVDTIKIDRAFISEIDSRQDKLEIVRAIVMLGKTLGMKLVAEGIETRTQLAALQLLECECGQGYLFSTPLPATDVEAWLHHDVNP
ncbi:MAG: EAL domain-containing protein [Cyanosarcina radialis HA8281-LM2]|jgi:diguanylate cyclase (GGDEF)-like protein/PAS domain S-box-containing protein|nr:EAL domain-containing protein [Cyanosarcina radialis HA8281-LM2]